MPGAGHPNPPLGQARSEYVLHYARLLAANVPAEIQILPGGDHGFDLMPLAISKQANARIAAFLSTAAASWPDSPPMPAHLVATEEALVAVAFE